MLLGNETDAEAMEILLKQLELGLPKATLGLLSMPISFSRGEYLIFHHQGIKTADELKNFSEETLQKLISTDSFERIKEYKNKTTDNN